MILIAYDSSDDAKAAIQHAGRLMRGQTAIVLSIWEPFLTMIARAPAGLGPINDMSDIERIDETLRRTAERHVQEGEQLARAAGLDASARVAPRSASIAEAILAVAEETGAAAIVLGSRGLTGLKSMMLGRCVARDRPARRPTRAGRPLPRGGRAPSTAHPGQRGTSPLIHAPALVMLRPTRTPTGR